MIGRKAIGNPDSVGIESLLMGIFHNGAMSVEGVGGGRITYLTRTGCQRSALNTGPGGAHMERFRTISEPEVKGFGASPSLCRQTWEAD